MRLLRVSSFLLLISGLASVLGHNHEHHHHHHASSDEAVEHPEPLALQKSPISREQLFKLFQGILKSTLKVSPIEQSCVRDANNFATLAEHAVELFSSYSFTSVAEGIKDLGLALTTLTDAMADCKAAKEDIEKISLAIAQLVSPQQLMYVVGTNLVLNGKDIFVEVRTAMFAWKNRDFETFGMALGSLLTKLLLPSPPTTSTLPLPLSGKMDDKEIAIGILEGFGSQFPALDKCIISGNNAALIKELRKAIELIQSENPKDVRKGMMMLGMILERDLLPAMKSCKGAEAEVKRIEEALALLSDPKSFAEHTGKNVVVNGKVITKESENAAEAFKKGDGRAFGRAIGVILEKIVVGSYAVEETMEEAFLA